MDKIIVWCYVCTWMIAFITVIGNREHDQDGHSVIKVLIGPLFSINIMWQQSEHQCNFWRKRYHINELVFKSVWKDCKAMNLKESLVSLVCTLYVCDITLICAIWVKVTKLNWVLLYLWLIIQTFEIRLQDTADAIQVMFSM